MPDPMRMALLAMLPLMPLTACNVAARLDPPPPIRPASRIVATSHGFAIERIGPDDERHSSAALVPLGRTIRLDPALLPFPSPFPTRSTPHAPSPQSDPTQAIGDSHDAGPQSDRYDAVPRSDRAGNDR
ncbi:hypothetical protein [Novosphingobium sp. BW1]|uniref:hypothetical protein n=1 Tax=Novosphingobium sp. BW1 TaxID=2592621 RepID=UPI0011DECBE1|nr:hypothetical protein [Novosphingobium sp. BW1]TYC83772.1 hypothetical protein FMM79_19030 [Novosphingobium sp. BW1]